MFLASEKAVTHLCDALFALSKHSELMEVFSRPDLALQEPRWLKILKAHGVYDESRPLRAPYDSWQSLKNHLDEAKRNQTDRLWALCSKILREKDKYASAAYDPTAFSDSLAQFEVQLELDGFRFNGFEILSKSTGPNELVFPPGTQYTAFKAISKILESATREVFVADNYLDRSVVEMLETLPSQPALKLLTFKPSADFQVATKRFKAQYGRSMEVKIHNAQMHDRVIIIDDSEFYALGASIKDIGAKLSMLNKLEDPTTITELRKNLGAIWASAALLA